MKRMCTNFIKPQNMNGRKPMNGIPLGMHLSVEAQPPPLFASRRDASFDAERGIPTGCHGFFALFSTERRIPMGCVSRRFPKRSNDLED